MNSILWTSEQNRVLAACVLHHKAYHIPSQDQWLPVIESLRNHLLFKDRIAELTLPNIQRKYYRLVDRIRGLISIKCKGSIKVHGIYFLLLHTDY
jgi:hypothetical protein